MADEEIARAKKYNVMSNEIKSVYKELIEDLENKESKGRKYKALINYFSQLVNNIPVLPVRPQDRDDQEPPYRDDGAFADPLRESDVLGDEVGVPGWDWGEGAPRRPVAGAEGGSTSKEAKKMSANVTKVKKKNIKKDGRNHETKKNVSKK